ncbi:MAG: hypothetical protein KZQ66_05575, partial [Candidatus Thiodiazotropha sp. (ex Lucinoma aequizonata)]|nr:hypothetical protein [Candidatus Thiodiazotropha sp. (ex Lucinoma aequizonata)]MCU7901525.1 hypothetical protein [Candidatus Thiodiazotropha sp. (ex Lucinoma aequizonata)]
MVKEFCTPQLSCFFPFQQLFFIVIRTVIIQLKNWKKCLTRFFCIFSDFKEDCLPISITIH